MDSLHIRCPKIRNGFVSLDQYRRVSSQYIKKCKALGMRAWQLRLELDDSCALFKFFTLAVIKKGDHVGDKCVQWWGGFLHGDLQNVDVKKARCGLS